MQGHHREKHHFRIMPETNNRMSSISLSISLCYAPSTSTHSKSNSRSFLFQNSLECVPFLCITFPQCHKINCIMECFNFYHLWKTMLIRHLVKTVVTQWEAIIFYDCHYENYEQICWPSKFQSYRECKNNDTNIHLDECSPCLAYHFDFELPTFQFS